MIAARDHTEALSAVGWAEVIADHYHKGATPAYRNVLVGAYREMVVDSIGEEFTEAGDGKLWLMSDLQLVGMGY